MRQRLRPAWSAEELQAMYRAPHDHTRWPDHVLRVEQSIALGKELMDLAGHPPVIADLSCGDAAIPRALIAYDSQPAKRVILGDFAPGYEITGLIEETVYRVARAGLWICCETIEHLDDPDAILARIRERASSLLLSTPLHEADGGVNPEHYWAWDHDGVREMLEKTGWDPALQRDLSWTDPAGGVWAYQIWGCR